MNESSLASSKFVIIVYVPNFLVVVVVVVVVVSFSFAPSSFLLLEVNC
jgi:hypothetical protein